MTELTDDEVHLSYNQHEAPNENQLKWISANRQKVPLAALFAYHINSGLHRFAAVDQLNPWQGQDHQAHQCGSDDPIGDLEKEIEKELPPNRATEIFENFTRQWDLKSKLLACATCGMRTLPSKLNIKLTTFDKLLPLRYTSTETSRLNAIPQQFRPAISHYCHESDVFHLHQELIVPSTPFLSVPSAPICEQCWQKISNGAVPYYSIANGVDFG